MWICFKYDLGVYYRPVEAVATVTYTSAVGTWRSLECVSVPPEAGDAADHTPAKGRSRKRGATVFNQCS